MNLAKAGKDFRKVRDGKPASGLREFGFRGVGVIGLFGQQGILRNAIAPSEKSYRSGWVCRTHADHGAYLVSGLSTKRSAMTMR